MNPQKLIGQVVPTTSEKNDMSTELSDALASEIMANEIVVGPEEDESK
jgi:hypothetical protein